MKPIVLIVEDDLKILGMWRDYLQAHQYQVFGATLGTEGMSLARTNRPHLILMDFQLPDGEGIDFARQMKADPELAQVPVVLITAWDLNREQVKGLATTCIGYIKKPVALPTLLHLISSFIKKGQS
jgi:DNA-binding response OmpR family regulator